jgi:hypothetical protein
VGGRRDRGFRGQPYQGQLFISAAGLYRQLASIKASYSIGCRPLNRPSSGFRGQPPIRPGDREEDPKEERERERGPRGKRGHDPAGPTEKSAAEAGGPRGRRGRGLTSFAAGPGAGLLFSQGISHNDSTGGR